MLYFTYCYSLLLGYFVLVYLFAFLATIFVPNLETIYILLVHYLISTLVSIASFFYFNTCFGGFIRLLLQLCLKTQLFVFSTILG